MEELKKIILKLKKGQHVTNFGKALGMLAHQVNKIEARYRKFDGKYLKFFL